jgi:hypothetical protein
MSKRKLWLVGMLVLALLAVVGCGAKQGGGASAGETAIEVTGLVDAEMAWTEDDLRAMETIEAESENKEGETLTYTGVPINDLLAEAGVQGGASTVSFVADDDYSADVALEELQACSDCIVSFRDQGGLSIIMPGFSSKLQVKGVVEIQVK